LNASGDDGANNVTVTIPGPIVSLEIILDNGSNAAYSGKVGVGDLHFGDPEGDMIDNNDAILPGEAPQDDIVEAGDGDDIVLSGAGEDDVYAGRGDDLVYGGAGDDILRGEQGQDELFGDAGDDVIYGGADDDIIYGDSDGDGPVGRESFEWDMLSEGQIDSSAVQDTGTVSVTYSRINDTGKHVSSLGTDELNTDGIDAGGEAIDTNSSLESETRGCGNDGDFQWEFSEPVENVDFNVNDIDGDGVVRITAYDADGNKIPVTLTGGNKLTLLDTDSVAGADTADSEGGYADTDNPSYNLQVSIAGPVAKIVLEHDQDGNDNSGIRVTDLYFDAIGSTGEDGDDVLFGGAGDDMIFGEGGDDTITGGQGADIISGGDDADLIIGGTDGDVVDGGTGGDDNDTLDLTNDGPLRVINQTVDADGDSTSGTVEFLDADGNVTGSLDFTEIENLLLPENLGPDAVDDTATTDEDTSVTIPVLGNDTDPEGDQLTVTEASSPNGDVVINPDGTITFTPNSDFNGDAEITYTITDGNGNEDTATVTVTVTPVNDDPDAVDDSASTDEDTPVTIDVLDNDTDADGDPLTVVAATSPDGDVVINPDGTITFTPNPNFTGEAEITYTVDDGNGGTDTATVIVTVGAVNDDPDAVDNTYVVTQDEAAGDTDGNAITDDTGAGQDSDPDSDTLTVTQVAGSAAAVGAVVAGSNGGLFTIDANGAIDFDANGEFDGLGEGETAETTVTYTISDGEGGTDTATVTFTVEGTNDGPVATDNAYLATKDEAAGDVDGNVITDNTGDGVDSDPDGDDLSVVAVNGDPNGVSNAVTGDNGGTFVINPDGTVDFNAGDDFDNLGLGESVTTSVTYTISDGDGGTDTGVATFTITGTNDGTVEGTAGGDLIDVMTT